MIVLPTIHLQLGHHRSSSQDTQTEVPADHVDTRMAELVKENAVLEKVSGCRTCFYLLLCLPNLVAA